MLQLDPVLAQTRQSLERLYGDRLKHVILFGSRARGDARPDSDYDVAVFLSAMPDRWSELDRLAELSLNIADQTGAIVNAFPYLVTSSSLPSPLLTAIRREGIEL